MLVDEAIEFLLADEVVVLPSDTLYGLAAIAYSFNAVKKVFDLKKRDYFKSLPVHYSNINSIENDCIMSEEAKELAKLYWPGGLTLVLPKKQNSKLKMVDDSVAVRIPNSSVILTIIEKIGCPLVMPSANISNHKDLYTFDEIKKTFNIFGIKNDEILKQKPSTIVSFVNDEKIILRKGVVDL